MYSPSPDNLQTNWKPSSPWDKKSSSVWRNFPRVSRDKSFIPKCKIATLMKRVKIEGWGKGILYLLEIYSDV